MFKYKHILIATDFTDETVVHRAAEVAKEMHAKLSVVHVVEPLPGYGYAFIGAADVEVNLVDEAKKQLAALGKKHDISVKDQHIGLGPTKTEINRIAEENHVDLIVVGSHGRHGLSVLLGSTANAVIHSAKCDVLTVRMKS